MIDMKIDTSEVDDDDDFFAEIGIQIAPQKKSSGPSQPDFSQISGLKKARHNVNDTLVPPMLEKCARKVSEASTADGLTEDYDDSLSVKSSAFTNTIEQRRQMKANPDRRP